MTNTPDKVGIDDIAVAVPRLFLSTTGEFARARGIEPAKLSRGIGVEKMAVPDAHEDAATLAASSTLDLMRNNDLLPEEVGRLYIGTESGVDEAKAMGTYVIGMLEEVYGSGTFSECSTVEFKSACIGATHALESVACWLKAGDDCGWGEGSGSDVSGRRRGRVGIVVATDVARYGIGSPGEYTQGAGSVALLVDRDPRILALDPVMGVYTRDENDFFRPIGMRCAVVNGKYSNQCYLTAMDGAFGSYRKRALSRGIFRLGDGEGVTDHLDRIIFHIPYPRMAEYAAASLFRREWRSLPRWREVEEEIGTGPGEPGGEEGGPVEVKAKEEADYQRRFSKSAKFLEAYVKKVKPSTLISSVVGNIYTGSIYLGLASLLAQDLLIPGKRIGLGSYGSGCSAAFFSGTVEEGIGSVARGSVLKKLDERVEIGLAEYEDLHRGERRESVIPPAGEFALLRIDGDGYRRYGFVQ
ncbi:hydroxymethylglutaryl-CoA synthase family protein [Candidatus Methanocrinis natronophilus]|uniref:Hydroxymethylglutaryl-CoA synthase n=1 Tax=Candidatus Methanocrinis natronophilus TaxID=3033396 RepID=A0ABT5X5X4_9EURY|nr:hydroxymethylglutaryl-CoA synthase [Candidatus Methanocrinis natronophilus]MDF0590101.1 hydroxymethylglutaryl-CoA synthase [Candidatus Methanocrinis natronophilus]